MKDGIRTANYNLISAFLAERSPTETVDGLFERVRRDGRHNAPVIGDFVKWYHRRVVVGGLEPGLSVIDLFLDWDERRQALRCDMLTAAAFPPTDENSKQLRLPLPALDAINPDHYRKGKVECIDGIESATVGLTGSQAYCTGAAMKYLWRWKFKNGLEDLRKAKWYLDRLIAEVEKQ